MFQRLLNIYPQLVIQLNYLIFRSIQFFFLTVGVLVLGVPNAVKAQPTINITTQPGTCSSNGLITVSASNGSGNYLFTLTDTCGNGPFFGNQNPASFPTLAPCYYSIEVLDEITGLSTSQQVNLVSNYLGLSDIYLVPDNCQLEIEVDGGLTPYTYFYWVGNPQGAPIPLADNVLPPISESTVYLSVIDACGNIIEGSSSTNIGNLSTFWDYQTQEGLEIDPLGGSPPYTFTLNSSAGTYTNSTGLFPWNQVGCNPTMTISDACEDTLTGNVSITVSAGYGCVSFEDGYAEITHNPGRAPYTYTVYTSQGTFTSNDSIFTNLPPNILVYTFSVEDACGVSNSFNDPFTTRYRLEIFPPESCSDDSIFLEVDRECGGRFNYPIQITCLSCEPSETVNIESSTQNEVSFTGNLPGEWEFQFLDDCGDEFYCKDSLIVELIPACDSIIANVVSYFYCDNGDVSRRYLNDTTAVFTLLDDMGNVLVADDSTGVFEGLSFGTYHVEAVSACGPPLSASVTMDSLGGISPQINITVHYDDLGSDSCRVVYDLDIEKNQGPYVLASPDNGFYQVLNNYEQDICRYYYLYDLSPGEYILKSMDRCGEIVFTLPELQFDTIGEISVISNCPNDAAIEIEGSLWSTTTWNIWFQNQGINIDNSYLNDRYYIPGVGYRSTSTIDGLTPGTTYTVYLIPATASFDCPVDSATIYIPPYQPPTLEVSGDLVCDAANSTDLTITVEGSDPPFSLRRIDCNNVTNNLQQVILNAPGAYTLEDTPVGEYCFVVVDGCQTSRDYQFEVRYFSDSIDVDYSCDTTLTLSTVPISAPITWKSEQGMILGTGNQLSLTPPNQDATFYLEIDLGSCLVERSIFVPYQEVIPNVQMIPNTDTIILCAGEQVSLGAASTGTALSWSTGDTTSTIQVQTPGPVAVETTNALGCTATDSIFVHEVPIPEPDILEPDGICQDEIANLSLSQPYHQMIWSDGTIGVPNISISQAGSYSVEVSDTYGCTATDSVFVPAFETPHVTIVGDSIICPGESTVLTATGPWVTTVWNTGSDNASIQANVGDYSIEITDNNGCQGYDDITVEERPVVTAAIAGDTAVCYGNSVQLLCTMTGIDTSATVTWIGPSGQLFTQTVQGTGDYLYFTPEQSGMAYLLEVLVDGYPCPVILTDTVELIVHELPTPTIAAPEGLCVDSLATLSIGQTYSAIIWSTGATDELFTSIAQYGLYSVDVVDENQCIGSDSVWIQDWGQPQVEILGETPICPGATTLLTVVDTFALYDWSTGASTPQEEVGLGQYSVTVENNFGCPANTSITVEEWPQVYVGLEGDSTICAGDSVLLEFSMVGMDTLANLTLWYQSASLFLPAIQNGAEIWLQPNSTGPVYIQDIEVMGYPCPVIITDSAWVEVNELTLSELVEHVRCPGGSDGQISLIPSSNYPPYMIDWSDGNTLYERVDLSAGFYNYSVTDALGCAVEGIIEIEQPDPISVEIGKEDPSCFGNADGSILLEQINGGTAPYEIIINNDLFLNTPAMLEDLPDGLYSISILDSLDCLFDTTIQIVQPPALFVELYGKEEISIGDQVDIHAVTNATAIENWWWSVNEQIDGASTDPLAYSLTPSVNTLVTLEIVDSIGCRATDSLNIEVDQTLRIYAPNAFSPNDDGVNDYFTLYATDGLVQIINSLKIFDRWGGLIFEKGSIPTNQEEEGWDGRLREKGQKCNSAVYVWLAELTLFNGEKIQLSGDVHLIR